MREEQQRQGEGGREERPARWRMEWRRRGEVCKEQRHRQSEKRRQRCEHGRRSSGASGLAQVRVRVRERMGGGLGENKRVREWV